MTSNLTTATHTPGPWTFGDDRILAERVTVALVTRGVDAECDETLRGPTFNANARLIAAAPDLLETLKALMQWVELETDDRDWPHAHLIAARDVIKKAEGVQ